MQIELFPSNHYDDYEIHNVDVPRKIILAQRVENMAGRMSQQHPGKKKK
jgi:hypothetical protein